MAISSAAFSLSAILLLQPTAAYLGSSKMGHTLPLTRINFPSLNTEGNVTLSGDFRSMGMYVSADQTCMMIYTIVDPRFFNYFFWVIYRTSFLTTLLARFFPLN